MNGPSIEGKIVRVSRLNADGVPECEPFVLTDDFEWRGELKEEPLMTDGTMTANPQTVTTALDMARNQSRFSFTTESFDPAVMDLAAGVDLGRPTPHSVSVMAVPSPQQRAIEQIVASLHDAKLRARIRRQFPEVSYWSVEVPNAHLNSTVAVDNTVTLSWTAGATGYNVYNVYGPGVVWTHRRVGRLAYRAKWWFLRQRGRIYDLLHREER